jgi:pyrimidine operon attenuation protein / uracil phosphoribosyltransferase
MAQSIPVLDAASIRRVLEEVAQQIIKKNENGSQVVLVGIQRGGVFLAQRLKALLEKQWNYRVPVGKLDVAMHRDDLDSRAAPQVYPTSIPFDINKKTVILVDDVLYKGRTVRAAMDALNDLGRPERIQLAVLVDRGHRELPIHADFVGKFIETGRSDRVDVRLLEDSGQEAVILETT